MVRTTIAWVAAAACTAVVSLHAQDTTVKSKTKVKADDAKVITVSGCLDQGTESSTFTLTNAAMSQVSTQESPEVSAVGTSGAVTSYELVPKGNVDLSAHVGQQVEITALALPAAGKDDDAKVKMKSKTKVKEDDAPDASVQSKTKAELPRGPMPRLTVTAVKSIAASCQ
jgi:hypothetical protein